MSHQDVMYHWSHELKQQLPTLTMPQVHELALWSIGMVLASKGTLSRVALELTVWLGIPYNTIRQRLKDWYRPASKKSGKRRKSVDPTKVFTELTIWVLRLMPGNRVVLALDATTLRDDLTVLCLSVLIGSCAIPVAWRTLPGNQSGEWTSHWQTLMDKIAPAVGSERVVLVLTDRGLWSRELYKSIIKHKWHPMMRTKAGLGGVFLSDHTYHPLHTLIPAPGETISYEVLAFKYRMPCTLIAFHGATAKEAWFLLTDLPEAQGKDYGLRMWIEHQFKKIKSDGWHWDQGRITDPERADRVWLAYSVSLLWTMSFGSTTENDPQFEGRILHRGERINGQPNRIHSLFAKGLILLRELIYQHADLRCPIFSPYSWT